MNVGTGPGSLAFAAGDLWVANSLDSTVTRINPATLSVNATIPVGSGPSAVIAAAGSVWVANQYSRSVSRIDPRRSAVTATVTVGGLPTSLTADGGRLWVGVDAGGASHRGGTLVIASVHTFTSVDPAFFNFAEPALFDGLVHDTLVTFDHTGGVNGLRLVPDLALTLPTPSDGGRTCAFGLRSGIRYSNGAALRASGFRRAIERLFRAGSPGTDFYTNIVGAAGCVKRPPDADHARCSVSHTDRMTSVVLEEVRFDTHLVQCLLDDWNDELIATIPGFTPRGGSTVEATDFKHPDGVFLLALSDDGPVGCGGLRRIAPGIAEVKRLYVRSRDRGRGTGRALLQHLEKHAHELGFTKVRLDTAGGQPAALALALFRSAGYEPIADYNGNPYARYWFEKRLTVRN